MGNVRPISAAGWNTNDPNEYNPHSRYTASTDDRGHSGWVKALRVPTNIVGEIAKIVESGVISEYDTAGALVRDAIVHHLHRLNEDIKSTSLEQNLNLVRINSEVQQRRKELQIFTSMIDTFEEEVDHLVRHRAYDEAYAYCQQMEKYESAIPARFLDEFKDRINRIKARVRP